VNDGFWQRPVHLTRLPSPAGIDEYEDAAREIEGLLEGLPGIVAVYRTGGVSAPGISDIDRIAIVEAGAPLPSVWDRMSPRTRSLAMHGPLLADVTSFRRHRWFAHLEPLELAFGDSVDLEERPLPSYSEPLIAAESMTVALLSMVKQISTGVLKVRPALCQLNNLRHALALARLDRDEAGSGWDLAGDVERLRGAWFESGDGDREAHAAEIAGRAGPALLEALTALGRRSASAHELSAGEPEGLTLGDPWSGVLLTSHENARAAVSGIPRLRLPLARSARLAELRWRAARPRIALHPGVLSLLEGRGDDVARFRSARDELVRGYRDFVSENRAGYSPIGFASPFLDD
jgi:hypothetical protein